MFRAFFVVVLVSLAVAPAAVASHGGKSFAPGAPGIGDPYFPLDGNGGYDARHYELELRYDPATDVLSGVAEIRAKARQNLSSFNLDLVGMNVRAIFVDGRRADFSRDEGELTVEPRRGLRRGEDFRTVVVYDGVPETVTEGGIAGFIHTDDGTLVAGQPDSAATWYPVNDHPLDKASYEFELTVPAGLEAIANGVLTDRDTRRGWTTWEWEAREPMASYLTTATIGEFDLRAYRRDGIRYWDALDPDLFDEVEPRTGSQYAMSQAASVSYKRLMRTIDVPPGGATLSFWVTRDTELNWDFMFVEANRTGTDGWTTLPDENGHTDQSTGFVCPFSLELHPFLEHYQSDDDGDGECAPEGSTGEWHAASGGSDGYEQWTVDLSGYAGDQVDVSISYATDDIFAFSGLFVDDITVSTGQGSTSFENDGETMDGWHVPGAPEGTPPNENDWIVGTAADAPPTTGELAEGALDRQPEIIDFLEGLFGRYPFSAAGGIVDDVEGLGFALENQTRPVYALDFFADQTGPVDGVVVHELAHQWAGDHLAIAAWQHIWLNEGFATYSEWLWSEREDRGTAQEIFDFYASIPADDDFWSVAIGDPGPELLFDIAVYNRGAMTLHALRLEIGDRDFFRLLRRWIATHGGGNVTTPQFVALAERTSGEQLDGFFEEWLFTPAKPARLEPAAAARALGTASAVRSASRAAHFKR
jgi:Peptidase family M1 domain/Peptidase M1 N-terminal domain/Immune inhibitor A peptidase M6